VSALGRRSACIAAISTTKPAVGMRTCRENEMDGGKAW